MLPIITAKLSGRNNQQKDGDILFDSGVQVSLISTNTAKIEPAINWKECVNNHKKVRGEEDVLETKVHRVPVPSLGSDEKFTVNALETPYISDDIAKTDVKTRAEGIGLSETKIYSEGGPIDILIRTDYAHVHAGETKQVDIIVARHSPLGWVIFGTAPGLKQMCMTRRLD